MLEFSAPSSLTKSLGGIDSVMDGLTTNGPTYFFTPPPPLNNNNSFIIDRRWRGGKLFPHPFPGRRPRAFETRNRSGVLPDLLGFTFACIFLVPMLVACGGGGGAGPGISGDSGSADMPNPPDSGSAGMSDPADISDPSDSSPSGASSLSHIDWLVSPSVARMSVNPDAPACRKLLPKVLGKLMR